MRWIVGLAILGVSAALFGWRNDAPELVRPGLWLTAPFVVVLALGALLAVATALFGKKRSRVSTYLNVPFAEKDDAKALGARWDPRARKWYAPAGIDARDFARWLPSDSPTAPPPRRSIDAPSLAPEADEADGSSIAWEGVSMKVCPPVYVAEAVSRCWKCGGSSPVIALAAESVEIDGERVDELALVSGVEALPPDLATAIAVSWPQYRVAYSKTARRRRYMNHCATCGAKLGDFFLHSEPGGAFFPMDASAAREIGLRRLDVRDPFAVDGDVTLSSPNLLHRHARRPQGRAT